MGNRSSNLDLFIIGTMFVTSLAIFFDSRGGIIQEPKLEISGTISRVGSHGNDFVQSSFLLKENNTVFYIDSSKEIALTKIGDNVKFSVNAKTLGNEERVNEESFVNLTLKEEVK